MREMRNKRGNVVFILVGIFISVISFFTFIYFFTNISGNVVSEADDLHCRGILSAKSNAVVKTGEFFLGDITQKCKKDEYVETVNNEEEVYDIFGESMRRCWFRYGAGQYDFMSSYNKEGNWCFTCAKIKIKDKGEDGAGVYQFNDLINWMKENEIKYTNGSKISYYDYMNLKYAVVDDINELSELQNDIEDLYHEGDSYTKELAIMFSEQYNYMQDLRLKEIRTDEDLYVVYRYDKPDNDASEKMKQAMWGAGTGLAASLAVTFVAENALVYGMTGGICLFSWTGVGAVACGAMVTYAGTKTAANIAGKAKSTVKGIEKIATISKRLTKMVRFSKSSQKVGDRFTGKIDEIDKIVDSLKDFPVVSKKFETIGDGMKTLKIDSVEDITTEMSKVQDKADEIDRILEVADEMLESEEFIKLVSEKKEYMDTVSELKNLKKHIGEAEKEYSIITEALKQEDKLGEIVEAKKKYLYGAMAVAGSATGAYVGSNLNFNSNQYVDIMTKEQYYRLCGTEPAQLRKK